MNRRLGLLGLVAAVILLVNSSSTSAATYYWSVSSGDWSTAANWGGTEPTVSSTAYIINGGTATISKLGETCGELNLGGADTGTVQMIGGELSSTSQFTQHVGYTGTGTFNQSGGTNKPNFLSIGSQSTGIGTYNLTNDGYLSVFGNEWVGYKGSGTFNQSGGTNTINFHTTPYLCLGYYATGNGTYNLSGTGYLSSPSMHVGYKGTGTFIQSGGTNTTRFLHLSYDPFVSYSDSSGTYSLSGSGQLIAESEDIGYTGTGTFTQSGGTNTVSYALFLGNNSSSNGTYKLNGGRLILKSLSKGSGTAAFYFGGGTLQASDTFSCSLPMTLTGTGGNANVDTAGYAVTLSGALSGTGGLNKRGLGTLTLSSSNAYTGNTTVSAGTLLVNGTLNSSGTAVTVGNDATLGGIGTINRPLNTSSGSTVSPGDNGVGTLTIATPGNVTISGTLLIDVSGAGAGSCDLFDASQVRGRLDITNEAVKFNILSPLDDPAYVFVKYGSLKGPFSGVPNLPAGYTINYSYAGNQIALVPVPEPSTLALLGVGALGLFAYAWRRRKAV